MRYDIIKTTEKHKQYLHDKVCGLSNQPKQHDKQIKHLDGNILDIQAEREGRAINKAYRSRTIGFGKRLHKHSGEKHSCKGIGKMTTIKHI